MIAAEQKARAGYEHLMNLSQSCEILEPLSFLREREIVHFQRFGECLDLVQTQRRLGRTDQNGCRIAAE